MSRSVIKETAEEYEKKKQHYQDLSVASAYDDIRFLKPSDRRRNQRKLTAVQKAITMANAMGTKVRIALDIPCGTGRLIPLFKNNGIIFFGADLSAEMMQVSLSRSSKTDLMKGMIRCDAERLPFRDNSVDSIFSIRFMFHIPEPVRLRMLVEMGRVSRRWVIIDYRHRYTFKYWSKKILGLLRISGPAAYRFSADDLQAELNSAGLEVVKIFPTLRLFSDKWVVLGQKSR